MINPRVMHNVFKRTYVVQSRLQRFAVLENSIHIDGSCILRVKNLYKRDGSNYPWMRYNALESASRRNFATSLCNFAKSKDRDKGNKKTSKVQVNFNELSEVINVKKLTAQMEKAVEVLKDNYTKNLTLRSTIGSIEQIPVTWEGNDYVLQEICQIARKPKILVLNVSAFPQMIPDIMKALSKSGMNLSPQQDGTTIFVPIPKVTKEHREGLAKNAKAMFIDSRDNIRDVQTRCFKSLKNKTDISVDTIRRTQDQVKALADQFIEEAEEVFKMKQKELLGESD